jgi:hypothetical protein
MVTLANGSVPVRAASEGRLVAAAAGMKGLLSDDRVETVVEPEQLESSEAVAEHVESTDGRRLWSPDSTSDSPLIS